MRLFIFEGQAEERVFKTLKHLFLANEEDVVCIYQCNIYKLYDRLKKQSVFEDMLPEDNDTEFDIVKVLNEILLDGKNHSLEKHLSEDFAEIFLFFDYDFHHETGYTIQENNEHLIEMLDYFSDETGNGKLYISYPMLEAYRYIKNIPDEDFIKYTVSKDLSKGFKAEVDNFSNFAVDQFSLQEKEWLNKGKYEKRLPKIACNWKGIIPMNATKANFINGGGDKLPESRTISQSQIFDNQKSKYIDPSCEVSVLSAFPLFLYEYLKPELLQINNTVENK